MPQLMGIIRNKAVWLLKRIKFQNKAKTDKLLYIFAKLIIICDLNNDSLT